MSDNPIKKITVRLPNPDTFLLAFPSPTNNLMELSNPMDLMIIDEGVGINVRRDAYWRFPISGMDNILCQLAYGNGCDWVKSHLMQAYEFLNEDSTIAFFLFKKLPHSINLKAKWIEIKLPEPDAFLLALPFFTHEFMEESEIESVNGIDGIDYPVRRIDYLVYPINQMSDFLCQLAYGENNDWVKKHLMDTYTYLTKESLVAFYLFKLLPIKNQ